jgi:hypothetical protein
MGPFSFRVLIPMLQKGGLKEHWATGRLDPHGLPRGEKAESKAPPMAVAWPMPILPMQMQDDRSSDRSIVDRHHR